MRVSFGRIRVFLGGSVRSNTNPYLNNGSRLFFGLRAIERLEYDIYNCITDLHMHLPLLPHHPYTVELSTLPSLDPDLEPSNADPGPAKIVHPRSLLSISHSIPSPTPPSDPLVPPFGHHVLAHEGDMSDDIIASISFFLFEHPPLPH